MFVLIKLYDIVDRVNSRVARGTRYVNTKCVDNDGDASEIKIVLAVRALT